MLDFVKISATGNDFIVIDNMDLVYSAENYALWKKLCERKINIGADGILLIEPSEKYDFQMRYINSDGGEVGMCGNGGRAISSFYYYTINNSSKNLVFETMNGIYKSEICGKKYKHRQSLFNHKKICKNGDGKLAKLAKKKW